MTMQRAHHDHEIARAREENDFRQRSSMRSRELEQKVAMTERPYREKLDQAGKCQAMEIVQQDQQIVRME